MEFTIKQVSNGYVVKSRHDSGDDVKVYKNTEELKLLEDIGRALLGRKVTARES